MSRIPAIVLGRVRRRSLLALVLFLALAAVQVAVRGSAMASRPVVASTAAQATAAQAAAAQAAATNCRYGVAAMSNSQWVPSLEVGSYLNFSASGASMPGVEFIRTVRLREDTDAQGNPLDSYSLLGHTFDQLRALAAQNPGSLWLIGNEPDRPVKGLPPALYARAYHDLYHLIKQADPRSQIAIAGLVQVTPGRLQYLDLVLDAYRVRYGEPMPVDVWNIHVYALSERTATGESSWAAGIARGTDPNLAYLESNGTPQQCTDPNDNIYCVAEHDHVSIFRNQIRAMRVWMKERGEQAKPLIITEFGQLLGFDAGQPGACFQDENGQCFTPARVRQFLNNSMEYLETAVDPELGYPADGHRLVQQWIWFSLYNLPPGIGYVSNLLRDNYHDYAVGDANGLTPLGTDLLQWVRAGERLPNLTLARTGPGAGVVGATGVQVTVRNNGNTNVMAPVHVAFYRDAALTQLIGTATLTAETAGCARTAYVAAVLWDIAEPGVYSYWAKVDPSNTITESNEGDNVLQGTVIVRPHRLLLPIVDR